MLEMISDIFQRLSLAEWFLLSGLFLFAVNFLSLSKLFVQDAIEYVDKNPDFFKKVRPLALMPAKSETIFTDSRPDKFVEELLPPVQKIEDSFEEILQKEEVFEADAKELGKSHFQFVERPGKEDSLSDMQDLDEALQSLDKSKKTLVLMESDKASPRQSTLLKCFQGLTEYDEVLCKGIYSNIDLITTTLGFFQKLPSVDSQFFLNDLFADYEQVVLFFRKDELNDVKYYLEPSRSYQKAHNPTVPF